MLTEELGLIPTTTTGVNYYTIASSGVFISEDDSLWLRRRNDRGSDAAYQLGAFTVNVVPKPSPAMGLCRRR